MGNLSRLVESLHNRGILSAAETENLLAGLPVSVEDLKEFIRKDPEKYNRAHIFKNDHVELLCLTWLPGQHSPIHGHGPTIGSVTVIAGQVFERTYKVQGRRAYLTGTKLVNPGQVFQTERGLIHQVGNASGDEVLVTLHLYSPPLSGPAPQTFEEAEPVTAILSGVSGAVVRHGH